jgi:hypothetical protein
MSTIALSDLEGRDLGIYLQHSKYTKYSNDKVIICGDVLDSTAYGAKKDDSRLLDRAFNLRNLLTINKNSNIDLICGNRDINKIKLLLLNKLQDVDIDKPEDLELIKKFNDGTIEFKDYDKLKEILSSIASKDIPIWKEDMKKWPLFWLNKQSTDLSGKKTTKNNIFHNRFIDLFSESMGASNVLYTIPLELGIKLDKEDDYYAFVVLVVYNSLLNKQKPQCGYRSIQFDKEFENSRMFSGLLFSVFSNMKLIEYKYIKETMTDYFFSHGGITEEFYNKHGQLYAYWDFILKQYGSTRVEISRSSSDTSVHQIHDEFVNPKLINFVSECNRFMKDVIYNSFTDTSPLAHIMVLLYLISVVKCEDGTLVPCTDNPFEENNFMPIMPGFREMITKYLPFEDYSVKYQGKSNSNYITVTKIRNSIVKRFNVFGHQPVGFSPMVKLVDNDRVVLINLDTSNSFLNTTLNESSLSYLYIDNDSTHIVSNIRFNSSDIEEYNNLKFDTLVPATKLVGEKLVPITKLIVSTNIFRNTNFNLEVTNLVNDNQELKGMSTIDESTTKKVIFHGKIIINKITYYAFTISYSLESTDYSQTFFILNISDLQTFFTPTNGNPIISDANLKEFFTSISDANLEKKYLKYKIKYINLKKNQDIKKF